MRRGRAGPQGAGSGCGGAFAARRGAAEGGAPPGGAGERPAGGGGGLGESGRHGGAGPGDGLHDPRAAGARQVGRGAPGPCPTGALGSGARGPARSLAPAAAPCGTSRTGFAFCPVPPSGWMRTALSQKRVLFKRRLLLPERKQPAAAPILPPFILIFFFVVLEFLSFPSILPLKRPHNPRSSTSSILQVANWRVGERRLWQR